MRIFYLIIILLFVASCTPTVKERIMKADGLAYGSKFKKILVDSGGFVLTTYQKISDQNSPYIFYIEGDGFISRDIHTISENPTPLSPIMLELTILDNRKNVIYIARPCQYTDMSFNKLCINKYWTDSRMSEEVVNSIANSIKKIAGNNKISLIGFSGGGGIAILVAPKLNHVQNIITIAGNLDIKEFAKFHKSKSISDSLNPVDYIDQVKNIPQLHISGGKDKIVPILIADKFVKAAKSKCVKQITIDSSSHGKGWSLVWQDILKRDINCD
jgi:hypothetical protein